MFKKTIILLVYIFCSFTLLVCGEKNILPIVRSGSRFFWPLGAGAARKKTGSRSRLGKNQESEPEPLEKKKSGAGAAKKIAGSPALVL